jgi:hypothetical protein
MTRIAILTALLSFGMIGCSNSSSNDSIDSGTDTDADTDADTDTDTDTDSDTDTDTDTDADAGVDGGLSPCEEACEMLHVDCGWPTIDCAGLPYDLLDCINNPNADCNGECILASDCITIATIISGTPDPTLLACIQACNSAGDGGTASCTDCVMSNCMAAIGACTADGDCSAYLGCYYACDTGSCMDATCVSACGAVPNSITQDLLNCAATNCPVMCADC